MSPKVFINALILLLGCGGCAVPLETIAMKGDASGWKVGYGVNRGPTALIEWIPENESILTWTRMLSVQFFIGQRASPRDAMLGQLASLKTSCPNYKTAVIAEDAASITYEWSISACPGNPPQHELVRFLRGNDGLHRVAYVRKVPALDQDERSEWLLRLADAVVVKDGKTVAIAP